MVFGDLLLIINEFKVSETTKSRIEPKVRMDG